MVGGAIHMTEGSLEPSSSPLACRGVPRWAVKACNSMAAIQPCPPFTI